MNRGLVKKKLYFCVHLSEASKASTQCLEFVYCILLVEGSVLLKKSRILSKGLVVFICLLRILQSLIL